MSEPHRNRVCAVCSSNKSVKDTQRGTPVCQACATFYKRNASSQQQQRCQHDGSCYITPQNRSCAPCRLTRCRSLGIQLAETTPSPAREMEMTHVCHHCGSSNSRKRNISCTDCNRSFHLSCVGITRPQADVLSVWHCVECLRGRAENFRVDQPEGEDSVTPPTDLAAALAELRQHRLVRRHIPRSMRHQVAADLTQCITSALEQRTPAAWWRLLSYAATGPLSNDAAAATTRRDLVGDSETTMTKDPDV